MEDALATAEKFKEEGNTSLKANDFDKAVEFYTKAIDVALGEGSRVPQSKLSVYYANRAFANIKLENYGLAIPDAEASIANNKDYEKAYLRLAFAKEVLQSYKEAYGAYLKVIPQSRRPLSSPAKKTSLSIKNWQTVKNKVRNTSRTNA